MDILGKSDPYVKMKLSGERLPAKKTTVKMRNLNPVWNEQFRLIVKDPKCQVLELHVFDWEKVHIQLMYPCSFATCFSCSKILEYISSGLFGFNVAPRPVFFFS